MVESSLPTQPPFSTVAFTDSKILTASPRSPCLPIGPAGPGEPGGPGAPGPPTGPVSPRSPCQERGLRLREERSRRGKERRDSDPNPARPMECSPRPTALTLSETPILTLTPAAPSLPGGPSAPGLPCAKGNGRHQSCPPSPPLLPVLPQEPSSQSPCPLSPVTTFPSHLGAWARPVCHPLLQGSPLPRTGYPTVDPTAHLASRFTRRTSQAGRTHGARGASVSRCSRSSLLARLTLGDSNEEDECALRGPSWGGR